ncbi:MAG: 50S ribosomal protein L3 [Candidatus Diapherotrites archaeon]|nr:50S ribosomal protein L3 [Candidatus Diapherotrites archaeon]
MTKLSRPRRGSLGFSPRKRAKRPYASPRSYTKSEAAKALAFPGYKAGMTHVMAVDKYPTSPSFDQTVFIPATIIECPPMTVFGIRAYEMTVNGLNAVTEVWAEKLDKNLKRKTSTPKEHNHDTKKIEEKLGTLSEIRLLVHTNPTFKKKPEAFEVLVGGDVKAAWEYAKSVLGKQVKASDVLKAGDCVDAIAITKGKGIQGPVKRWGTKIQYRKAHGKRRHVGVVNPWTPNRTMWTALEAGQMGYHRRTEFNKRILAIGEDGKAITPKGGIPNYGVVKSEYVLVKGSLPGTKKRLVVMRPPARPTAEKPAYEVKSISTDSQQGKRSWKGVEA